MATFEEFFRENYAPLVALGAWMTGDRSSGEDLAQEAMRATADRWTDVGCYEAPLAFTRRVLVNLASNERRRRRREWRALHRLTLERQAETQIGTTDNTLWMEVTRLPRRQRAAIGLRYVVDLSASGIAEVLGCSEATVRVHLHRAHRRLAERMGEVGGVSETAALEAPT